MHCALTHLGSWDAASNILGDAAAGRRCEATHRRGDHKRPKVSIEISSASRLREQPSKPICSSSYTALSSHFKFASPAFFFTTSKHQAYKCCRALCESAVLLR
eukprot:416197-Amphidinium_carterae.1